MIPLHFFFVFALIKLNYILLLDIVSNDIQSEYF